MSLSDYQIKYSKKISPCISNRTDFFEAKILDYWLESICYNLLFYVSYSIFRMNESRKKSEVPFWIMKLIYSRIKLERNTASRLQAQNNCILSRVEKDYMDLIFHPHLFNAITHLFHNPYFILLKPKLQQNPAPKNCQTPNELNI